VRPFASIPFASLGRLGTSKTYTFLEAWRGLVRDLTGLSVTPYKRPQAAKNADRVFYRLSSRDHLQGVTSYLGARTTYLEVVSCSLHPSMAMAIDLEIQAAIDRWSGVHRGHTFHSIVHEGVTRSSYRNGNDWIWYTTSTYRVHHSG
jgi:hypothetical protein